MKKGYTHISLLIDSSGSMGIIRDATITNYNKFIKEQKEVPGAATLAHYEFSSGSKRQVKSSRPTRHLVGHLPAKYANWMQQQIWNNLPANSAVQLGGTTQVASGFGGAGAGHPNFGAAGCVGSTGYLNLPSPTTNEFSIVEDFVDLTKAVDLNVELFVPHGWTPLLDSIGRAIFETGEKLAALKESERPEKVLFIIITDGAENASVEYSRDDIKTVVEHQRNTYNWDFIFLGANMDAIAVGTSYGVSAQMSANFVADASSIGGSTSVLSGKTAIYRSTADVSVAKSFLNYSDADRTVSLGGVSIPTSNNDVKTGTI